MPYICPQCSTPFAEEAIDRGREIATCGACGQLADLRKLVPVSSAGAREPAASSGDLRVEERIGVADMSIPGVPDTRPTIPPASPAAGVGIALLPLLFVGLGLGLFFLMTDVSVDGTLHARGGEIGEFAFAADGCTSGERRSFFGVELTSSSSPSTRVRAMLDPVQGPMLAVERSGMPPVVLHPANCETLDVHVERTNTNINDIWAVRGHVDVDCPHLEGSIEFDGCH